MDNEETLKVRPHTGDREGDEEDHAVGEEAMLDWYDFPNDIIERDLWSRGQADEHSSTYKHIDSLSSRSYNRTNGCENLGSNEEPAAPKYVGEAADQCVT